MTRAAFRFTFCPSRPMLLPGIASSKTSAAGRQGKASRLKGSGALRFFVVGCWRSKHGCCCCATPDDEDDEDDEDVGARGGGADAGSCSARTLRTPTSTCSAARFLAPFAFVACEGGGSSARGRAGDEDG